jgi:hypothetical protein
LGIEISCNQWKAQACTQGALLLFLLNFGRRGPKGGGEISFHFSLVPNVFLNIILPCVLSHFHLLRSLKPHPHPLPPLHEKNKKHDPPKPLAHAFFEKEKSTPKSPHPPYKSQKYLPQHLTISHPKVDIFNFLDCPPIEASLGLSTLFCAPMCIKNPAIENLSSGGWQNRPRKDC